MINAIFGLPGWVVNKLDGFKTYLAIALGLAVQISQILPVNTLSTALGLTNQGAAIITVLFLLLAFYGRMVAKPKSND